MSQTLWRVAVDAPLPQALTYTWSGEQILERGQRVHVPLGKRVTTGVVLGPSEPQEGIELRPIESLDPECPRLPEAFLKWLEWMSDYYIHPIGPTVELAFPPLKKRSSPRKSQRSPVIPEMERTPPPRLTEEQESCLNGISLDSGFQAHLVFGVTGSGKTEIYLRLLEDLLSKGKTAIVLVPEISLTPQLIQRFAARFGDQIAALHSQLTDRERTEQWWDMVEGRKKILIGARSALFCPIPNLGLIIVDEEHEPSYKQDEKLKYHGRDAAVMLASLSHCPIILGSATPSLESWKNALDGKYRLHRLRSRVEGRALPDIKMIDLRNPTEADPRWGVELPFWMSAELYLEIQGTLSRGEQAALFLNRRGLAHLVLCSSCGFTLQCPNCDINLTLHAGSHLVCHYCDYHENLKTRCPDCREGELESFGLGTELIEKDLARVFPEARLARADRDEIQNRADLEDLISKMEKGEIDILVGTQMIAKGLDFPHLKLVGLILADIGFNLPDFRATERSFQLITQMSGRSGRHVKEGESPGLVLVQTYNTQHESLKFALQHDFEGFAAQELEARSTFHYPPHGRLISLRIMASSQSTAREVAQTLSRRGQALKDQFQAFQGLEILGPAEAPLAKIRNQFRFHLLVKGRDSRALNAYARRLLADLSWLPPQSRILVDIDPLNLL